MNPDVGIDGQLVYAKAGNLWIQQGTQATKLTTTGRDSQPAWSEDGAWIYFIETRKTKTYFPRQGLPTVYDLRYPILTRIRPDGSERTVILSGLYRSGTGGKYGWSYFIRDPAVAPNGRSVAVVSDGPDPTESNVVLGLVNVGKKRLVPLGLAENSPYGHQDPAWRPDGKFLLYVRNARDGARGSPTIWRYDVTAKKATPLQPARVHRAALLAERALPGGHQGEHARHGHRRPRRAERERAAARDQRRPIVGRRLVARRDADRLPAARRVDHRPPGGDAGAERGRRPLRREDRAADRVQRPRRRQPPGWWGPRPTPVPTPTPAVPASASPASASPAP